MSPKGDAAAGGSGHSKSMRGPLWSSVTAALYLEYFFRLLLFCFLLHVIFLTLIISEFCRVPGRCAPGFPPQVVLGFEPPSP